MNDNLIFVLLIAFAFIFGVVSVVVFHFITKAKQRTIDEITGVYDEELCSKDKGIF